MSIQKCFRNRIPLIAAYRTSTQNGQYILFICPQHLNRRIDFGKFTHKLAVGSFFAAWHNPPHKYIIIATLHIHLQPFLFTLFILRVAKVLQRHFSKLHKCPKALNLQGFSGTCFAYWYYVVQYCSCGPACGARRMSSATARLRPSPIAAQ